MRIRHLLFILLTLSILYRALFLFTGIPSVTHDEGDLYYSGYVVATTGTDEYKNRFFLTTGFLTAKPSVPIYISALGWKLAPIKNVFFARLPFAILNSFIPIFLFIIMLQLTKKKLLATLGFLVLNFAPWFSYLSISGYEGMVALFFFFLTMVFVLSEHLGDKQKLSLSSITLFMLFNSYMGIRLIFPFIIATIGIVYLFHHKKKVTVKIGLKLSLISVGCSLLFFVVGYLLPNTQLLKKDASQSLLVSNTRYIEPKIEIARGSASGPRVIVRALFNKATFIVNETVDKYLYSFNIPVLFLHSDSTIYGTNNAIGIFYLSDLLFLIFGIYAVFRFAPLSVKSLMLMLLFGGIPIALSAFSPTIIFRGILLIVPYSILIAYGLYYIIRKLNKNFALGLYIGLILVNTLYFCILTQVQLINLSTDAWHLTEKQLFDEIKPLIASNKKVTVYTLEPRPTFILYAFYNVDHNTQFISDQLNKNRYYLDNISFSVDCPKTKPSLNEIFIVKKNTCSNVIGNIFVKAKDNNGSDYYLQDGTTK